MSEEKWLRKLCWFGHQKKSYLHAIMIPPLLFSQHGVSLSHPLSSLKAFSSVLGIIANMLVSSSFSHGTMKTQAKINKRHPDDRFR